MILNRKVNKYKIVYLKDIKFISVSISIDYSGSICLYKSISSGDSRSSPVHLYKLISRDGSRSVESLRVLV
jgi:hypothetical protein